MKSRYMFELKNRKYSYLTIEYIRRQFEFDLIQNDEGDD